MFDYMFGGGTIETLIKEVDEEERATESSTEGAQTLIDPPNSKSRDFNEGKQH